MNTSLPQVDPPTLPKPPSLNQSEERYRDCFENAKDAIYVHDLNGRYIMVNKAGEELIGYSRDEILQMRISDVVPQRYLDQCHARLKTKLADHSLTIYEVEAIKKDGSRIPVEVSSRLIYENDVAVAVQGSARDITERKRAEEELRTSQLQLQQSQKLEAIGRLAGGVAHDFNNMLTAIIGYTDLSLRRVGLESPIRRNLEETKRAAERAAALVRQLLAFSRKQILEPKVLDLNDVVRDLHKMLTRLIGENIQLATRPEMDLGSVKADPCQVEQIILNLVVNARDAMPRGGKVTIETANITLDDTVFKHVSIKPGEYVMLAVSDTGSGMDQATLGRIFEPFFTTKELGKGTGLGLSTVYGIVKQSGGNIWVYSEPGMGTVFKIYLPRIDESVDTTVEKLGQETNAPRGSETILLVEDEDVVRGLIRKILMQVGYNVLDAKGGEEAIRLCGAHAGGIDLLLTDVVMPEMSGKEVADLVLALQPKARILFMSGYTDEAIVQHGVLDAGVEFIQKPFTWVGLARKVREVLTRNHEKAQTTPKTS